MYQENFGKFLELIGGFLAISTSIAYVILQYIEPNPGQITKVFNQLDYVVCCFFLFIYTLKWYVATHRI